MGRGGRDVPKGATAFPVWEYSNLKRGSVVRNGGSPVCKGVVKSGRGKSTLEWVKQ